MPYINNKQWEALKSAASAATMDTACFGDRCTRDLDGLTWPNHVAAGDCATIHDKTSQWRQSWVTGPLAEIIGSVEIPKTMPDWLCPKCGVRCAYRSELVDHYADSHALYRSNQPKTVAVPG